MKNKCVCHKKWWEICCMRKWQHCWVRTLYALMSCGEHDYYSKQSQRKINHDRFTGEKKTTNPEEMPKIVIQEDWLSIKKVYHIGGLDFSESNLYLKFSSLPSLNILRREVCLQGKSQWNLKTLIQFFFL